MRNLENATLGNMQIATLVSAVIFVGVGGPPTPYCKPFTVGF